jgi:DNA repair exonuclease SbcCD nuclease subunit/predicted GIY-YIG superfamily endonuclease
MAGAVKILHTADSHIGSGWPARLRHDRPRRGDDLVDSYRRVLSQSSARGVDLVIHAGDVFDRPHPSAHALVAAAEPLLDAAVAGIPVVVIPGNHERCAIPGTVLLAHPNIRILDKPATCTFSMRGTRIAVSGFPCLRRDAAARFDEALDATEWHRQEADIRILAVHQTFESATCGPGNYRFRSGDDVVERDAVPGAFDYVAAGHVHRHQELTRRDGSGPPIVYAGSPDRISFAETDEPKGYVLVDAAPGALTHSFVEHDVRPMSVWPMDVSGMTQRQIRSAVRDLLTSLPRRALAQLRLTGRTTRRAMQGVRFTTMAWQLRPDVLFTASTRGLDWEEVTAGVIRVNPRGSAFDALDAPPADIKTARAGRVRTLPAACGVYVLYDEAGRVLYVGKARHVRSRVQTHLRGKGGANYFRGWTQQIARVETRRADSDLEALLVEAELVRRLRPPYNRQMRRWNRYCYLHESGRAHQQLEVTDELPPHGLSFGPFRSRMSAEAVLDAVAAHFRLARCPDLAAGGTAAASAADGVLCDRFALRLCSGPCADKVAHTTYRALQASRDAFLRGDDDASLRAEEARLEATADTASAEEADDASIRMVQRLRATFDYCATIRDAERLMLGWLILPGPGDIRTVVHPTSGGLRFERLANRAEDVERVRARFRPGPSGPVRRLSKVALDGLCIAVRRLRSPDADYRRIDRREVADLPAGEILSQVFGSRRDDYLAADNARQSASSASV